MERPATVMFRIGDWRVSPAAGEISRDGETVRLETRTMRLLMCLAERAGEVVSIEDLLKNVWPGVAVTPDSVYQAVASLRRQLGDDPKQPTYIATVPRLGYRMVAQVLAWEDQPDAELTTREERTSGSNPGFMRAAVAALLLALAAGLLFRGNIIVPQPQESIAVLPFLDLTEGMKQEEFADGMTEELIDKFSKVPGLRVPSPTSIFYYKGKQIPVGEIAKSLGVAYVLDGSVRKSETWLRIATRLVRADNGFIVWSETYDRPFKDLLIVQDEIAGEVVKALGSSIAGRAGTRLSP